MPDTPYSDKYGSLMQQLLDDEQQKGRPSGMLTRLRARAAGQPLTDDVLRQGLSDEVKRAKDPQQLQALLQAHGLAGEVFSSGDFDTRKAMATAGWDTFRQGANAIAREPSLWNAAGDEMGEAAKAGLTSGVFGRQSPDAAHMSLEELQARTLGSVGGNILGTMGQYGAFAGAGALARRSPVVGPMLAALETVAPGAPAAAARGLKAIPGMIKRAPAVASAFVRNNLPEVTLWAGSGASKGYNLGREAAERADIAVAEGRTPDAANGEYYDTPMERLGRMAIGGIAEPFNAALPAREPITATGVKAIGQAAKSLAKHIAPQAALNAAQEGADAAVSGRDASDNAWLGGLMGTVLSGVMGGGGIVRDALKGRAAKAAEAAAKASGGSVASRAQALLRQQEAETSEVAATAAPGRNALTPEVAGGPPAAAPAAAASAPPLMASHAPTQAAAVPAPSIPGAPAMNLGGIARASMREGMRKPLPSSRPQVLVPNQERTNILEVLRQASLEDFLRRLSSGELAEGGMQIPAIREVPRGVNLTVGPEAMGNRIARPAGVAVEAGPRSLMTALGPTGTNAEQRFATLLPEGPGNPLQMPYKELRNSTRFYDWFQGMEPSVSSVLDPGYASMSPLPFSRQNESFVAIGRNAPAPAGPGDLYDPTSVRYNLAMPGQDEYMVDVPMDFDPALEESTLKWIERVNEHRKPKPLRDGLPMGANPMANPQADVIRALAAALSKQLPEGDVQGALRTLMSSHSSGSPF